MRSSLGCYEVTVVSRNYVVCVRYLWVLFTAIFPLKHRKRLQPTSPHVVVQSKLKRQRVFEVVNTVKAVPFHLKRPTYLRPRCLISRRMHVAHCPHGRTVERQGWTKKESRGSAEPTPSAAEEAAFASAVARCLAQLPSLAAHERDDSGGGEVIPASSTSSGAENGNSCSDPTSAMKVGASYGTAQGQNGEGGEQESEMMDVDTPVSEVARGEETVERLGGDTASAGEKRELVPGVAWPEWRGPRSSTTVAHLGVEEAALPIAPAAEASNLGKTSPSPIPPTVSRDGLVAPGAGTAPGLTGKRGALWFPPSLTSRQRVAVMTAAGELGFCHDSVIAGGEAGGVHVVVWEPAAALTKTTSQEGSAPLPTDAPAVVVAGPPSRRSSTRRGSPLFMPQAVMPEPANSTEASEGSTQTPESQAGVRRDSVTVTRSAAGLSALLARSAATATAAAGAAAEADDGKSTSSSSVNRGVSTTTTAASEESLSSSGVDGGNVAAAPITTTAKSRLRNLDYFSGDAVYAWGEGPPAAAAAAAPSEAVDVSEELDDHQEWSVWSRDPQTILQGNGQAGEGCAGPANNGATEMEEEPSPSSSPAGGDEAESKRAETLREMRRNACFVVVGAVDGVAEEVTDAPEDAETWETRRVVVEVKNRMSKAKQPPPLYDQIQLVVRRGGGTSWRDTAAVYSSYMLRIVVDVCCGVPLYGDSCWSRRAKVRHASLPLCGRFVPILARSSSFALSAAKPQLLCRPVCWVSTINREAPVLPSHLAERATEDLVQAPTLSVPAFYTRVEILSTPLPRLQSLVHRSVQTYMLMIGAPVGDLVQFVKTGSAGGRGNGKRDPSAQEAGAAAGDVLVSRVELDCRAYHHKKHWEETILPRLYAFARMVYRFRGDDLLRWRYLLATPVRSLLLVN